LGAAASVVVVCAALEPPVTFSVTIAKAVRTPLKEVFRIRKLRCCTLE
jgi:hypothetical protein